MVRNAIQFLLACGALVVLYLPIREYLILRTVTAELDALQKFLGDFEIADPKKVYIRALQVNRPLEYAWRVYLPENMTLHHSQSLLSGGGGASGLTSSQNAVPARQFVLSYRLSIESDYIAIRSRGGGPGPRRDSNGDNPQHARPDRAENLSGKPLAAGDGIMIWIEKR